LQVIKDDQNRLDTRASLQNRVQPVEEPEPIAVLKASVLQVFVAGNAGATVVQGRHQRRER
jgi:hypothetical protein